jgi:hypothetical protein
VADADCQSLLLDDEQRSLITLIASDLSHD